MFAAQKNSAGKALQERAAKKEKERERQLRISQRNAKIASGEAQLQGYFDRQEI